MRLALAQFNPTIGDLAGNAALIARFADRAREARADLVVFPELALTGYPPRDLLLQRDFIGRVAKTASALGEAHSSRLTLVFGAPLPLDSAPGSTSDPLSPASRSGRIANALLAYRDGALIAYYDKRLLPTYDIFDEDRYFTPGSTPCLINVAGLRVGLSICEDLWRGQDVGFADRYATSADPVAELITPPDGSPGAQLIINPSASPFRLGIGARHRALLQGHATRNRVFVAAVNQVGGNDDLVFDGSACCFDPTGSLIAAGPSFAEALTLIDIPPASTPAPPSPVTDPLTALAPEEALFRALVLGVRDYLRKTGFSSAILGLSGGIDSALVAVIAAAALGPARIHGISLPSRYSSQGSLDDAASLARVLGIAHQTISIEGPFDAALAALTPALAGKPADVTEENLQSRLRGTLLMALSNKHGHLLLTTGNKSELAVGYCTLYGDMNGGLAVISDVAKTLVYRVARWINAHWHTLGIPGLSGPPIPESSITKPPSAELRPDQTDQDSLPPYDVLDEIIERYVEERQPPREIIAALRAGPLATDEATIRRMIRLIDVNEFKRRQAAPGLKVTSVAFGTGRRMPIAARLTHD